ncbi:MAG: sensor histidine kinase [Ignavibacteriales bacterium]
MNNPLYKLRNFAFYLFIWITIIVIHILFLATAINLSLQYAVLDSLIFNISFMGLGFGFWYSAKFLSFDRNSVSAILLQHTAAALFASLICQGLGYFLLVYVFNIPPQYKMFLSETFSWRLLIGMLYYVIMTSFYYLFIYYNSYSEKLLKESELKSFVRASELRTLKYQINPHFIFNSLNSVSSLITINPAKAREMTIRLSDYLRSTLANNEKQFNPLQEELNNVRLYIEIEKVRFEDKFEFLEEIDPGCNNISIPAMMLQPLLENAIKYGVYESLEKVTIRLICHIAGSYLTISVENNFDEDGVPRSGEKIGLKNIKDRLRLIYNQDNLLMAGGNNGIFTATIFIPIKEV